MVQAAELSEAFDEAGYRLTSQRRALAGLIAARQGHFTAEDLLHEATRRRLGLARATIFRSLDILEELGALERIDLPSGGHAFVACRAAHHHHLVCSRCGRSTDIAATGLTAILGELETRTGYRIDSHRLEVFGLCPACRRDNPSRTSA